MKLIYSTITGFVVLFVLGFIWFGVIGPRFAPNVMTSSHMGSVPLHIVADLCLAFLMAMIYPMGFKGGSAMSEGIKFGLLIGLVAELPGALHMYASEMGNIQTVIFFLLYGIIMVPIAGIAIAMVYGGQKVAAA